MSLFGLHGLSGTPLGIIILSLEGLISPNLYEVLFLCFEFLEGRGYGLVLLDYHRLGVCHFLRRVIAKFVTGRLLQVRLGRLLPLSSE